MVVLVADDSSKVPGQTASTSQKHAPWQHSLPVGVRELLAGGVAGGLSKTSVAPLERCKILFQTGKVQHGSVVRALQDIFRSEGTVGFFRGNGASVMRIVPYSALYMSSYERYRRLLVEVQFMAEYAEEGRTSPVVDLVAGSAAGASAVIVTYPLDLVHTRLAVMIETKPAAGGPSAAAAAAGGGGGGEARQGAAQPPQAAGAGAPRARGVGTAAAAAAAAAEGGKGKGAAGPAALPAHTGGGAAGAKQYSSSSSAGGGSRQQSLAVGQGRTLVGWARSPGVAGEQLLSKAQVQLQGAGAGRTTAKDLPTAGCYGARTPAASAAHGVRSVHASAPVAAAAAKHHRPTIAGVLLGTLRQEGVRGVYHGIGPSLYGILPYAGLKFYMYQALKGRFHSMSPERMTGAKNNRLPVPVMLAYGAVAGLVAQTVTYPLDVVRRRMQVEGMQQMASSPAAASPCPAYTFRSTPQALLCMAQREGVRSLYAGLSINYLKVVPSTAIAFTIYDYMKSHLDLSTNL